MFYNNRFFFFGLFLNVICLSVCLCVCFLRNSTNKLTKNEEYCTSMTGNRLPLICLIEFISSNVIVFSSDYLSILCGYKIKRRTRRRQKNRLRLIFFAGRIIIRVSLKMNFANNVARWGPSECVLVCCQCAALVLVQHWQD